MLLAVVSLSAQVPTLDDLVKSARSDVARQPADVKLRLNLAYLLMLRGDTADALTNYQTVLLQDSLNADAASGELWAYNTMGQWQQTLDKSEQYLTLHPEQATLYNFRAYAFAEKGYAERARLTYKKALQQNPAQEIANHSYTGLGWAYLALRDYPAALKSFRKAASPITDEATLRALGKAGLRIILKGSTNYDSTYTYGASLSYQQRRFRVGLAWEDLLVNSEHLRYGYKAELGYRTNPLDFTLNVGYLEGEDSRIYPGILGSLKTRARVYLGALIVEPELTQHLGVYERFNIYQTDLGLSVLAHPWFGSYSYSLLFEDSDSVGSDVRGSVHSVHLGYKFPGDYSLGAYATLGNQSWWTSPFGVTIDDFEPATSVYGLSFYAPLPGHFGVLLYHQLGLSGFDLRQLSSINVSYNL